MISPDTDTLSTEPNSRTQSRYRALLNAARNIFSVSNVDHLVFRVLRHATEILECERCSMFLPDPATKQLVIHSSRGKDDRVDRVKIPWDKGIAGTCFQNRERFRIDDAVNDPRIYRPVEKEAGLITRAMLAHPLADRDDCFGVLQAINPIGRPHFHELDVDIFEGLVNIVTGALVRFDREERAKAATQIERELALAVEIQKSFLPPEETFLDRAEFLVRYRPARSLEVAISMPFSLWNKSGYWPPSATSAGRGFLPLSPPPKSPVKCGPFCM